MNIVHRPKRVLGHLWPPLFLSLWVMVFNEALSGNPRVSTIDVNFVMKGMTCIVNSYILQWV